MSDIQHVWVGSINFCHVNIYSIGMNFPNLFDPLEQQKIESKIIKMRDLKEYQNSQELADLRTKNKALNSIAVQMESTFQGFNKLNVLPNKLLIMFESESLPSANEYIFKVRGGGVILNETCADILRKFNLGESTLAPVQIYKYKSTELWSEETFYFLNSCEQRRYVNATQPEALFRFNKHYHDGGGTYRLATEMADNHLEVEKSATDCDVDLWHDTFFAGGYFFSDRLRNALVEAGLHEKWDMHRCKLV